MLRRADNVQIHHAPGLIFHVGWLAVTVGKQSYRLRRIHRDEFSAMVERQDGFPEFVMRRGDRTLWWFQRRFYWDNDDLNADEVRAVLITREQRQRQQISRAQEIVAIGAHPTSAQRGAIADDLKQLVWTRDRGQCRTCGSRVELQFDHIIPVALGGATSAENLQILCGPCNRRKGASIVSPATPSGTARLAGPPQPSPAPGWYPDPGGGGHLRWWDGGTWTEHVTGDGPMGNAPPSLA